ncbi:MAG: F0F1 ATP synthase subunit A [Coriobacteriia bacterium]|nr:F0F1 ATP synthase subunit A [Coriobacteriia bacterium]
MEEFDSELAHLLADLQGLPMYDFGWGSITPFTFWMFISVVVVFLTIWYLKKKISFIPKFGFETVVEAGVDFVRREVGETLFGAHSAEHMPYLCTVFFFILIGNAMGLIPGAKSATGTMSVTLVLSGSSFLYFNYAGVKHSGFWHYIISIAPAGLPPGVNVMVWAIEVFSMTMRIVSLAIRLFANMFAGHLAMGVFALLATTYFTPLLHSVTSETIINGAVSGVLLVILMAVYAAEILVAFIQAYVFTLLSGVYIQLATSEH